MNKILLCLTIVVISVASCQKKIETVNHPPAQKGTSIATDRNAYTEYTIRQGEQYCDKSELVGVKYQQLNFLVKFDSSAVYKTNTETNQDDINKLFGFSDNNASHHQFSARFGWRWSNQALRLFGYTYNRGIRRSQELGTAVIGTEISCSIKAYNGSYVFVLNGKETTMLRESTTTMAEGYKLYPYFGGDESAPHTIKIWIKEL